MLWLTAGIAALLAWWLQDPNQKVVWLRSTLVYQSPEIPKSYSQAQFPGKDPESAVSVDFSNLFLEYYRNGWRAYRYHFYRDFDLANDEFTLMRGLEHIEIALEGLDSARALAYASGYNDCRAQINELLSSHQPDELRSKLARKKADRWPLLVIAIACLAACVVSLSKFNKR